MTKKPSYRFAGYTESWEEKKLGEVSTHRSGTSIEKYFAENGVYKVISIGSYGLDGKYIDQGIRAISNEVTDKKIVKENELTMVLNDKTSNGTIIGRTLLIKSSNEFVVNQRTEIISPKEILDSRYAYVLLNGNFREQVKKIVQGGTQIYVNYSSVEQLKLPLPSLTEQTAIGSFFQDIDQLISLQQRKLEVLKEQKKTYLKLLFPSKGQTKPALRFVGFEDEWKEVKLGDFVEISKGIQRNKEFLSPNADSKNCYPVYNGGKQESGYTDEFNREGNIMISEGGASAGFVNYFDGKYWSGGHNFTIDELENDIYYVLALLESQQQELYSLQVGSGLPNIQLNSLKKVIITFPAFLEQQAIGSFFQDLDKAIAKQEEKVNQLKESKQTLLRKMFI